MSDLTQLEQRIVDLLEEGYVRWKIAQLLGIGETKVRGVIRDLCERYDCPARDLPEAIRKENHADSKDRGPG